MTGYVRIPQRNLWMSFSFSESVLTVYGSNPLPIDSIHINYDFDFISRDKLLIGIDIEKNSSVIFVVNQIPYVEEPSIWTSTKVNVYYYLALRSTRCQFRRMHFTFPELDYFYSVNYGIERDLAVQGPVSMSVKTLPYEATERKFIFFKDGVRVDCFLAVLPSFSYLSISPITLKSTLCCQFEATNNMDFLLDIYYIVLRFFWFVSYRKNIDNIKINLSGVDSAGESIIIGDLYIVTKEEPCSESAKILSKTLEYKYVENKVGELFQIISDRKIYLEHIPESKKDSRKITPVRFILITAAFEWSVNNYFAFPLSERRKKVNEDVLESIRKIPNEKTYTNRLKEKLRFYENLVSNVEVNLSEKIIHTLNAFKGILDPFIENLYKINGLVVDPYSKMGDRIQEQRNAYAHGNIDIEFDSMVILDIIILEWVIYCIILKIAGYDDDNVYNIINCIFNRNLQPKDVS